ncbi:MAG: VacJ family lipoprotein [Desulfatiglandaceae bacterium]
MESLYRVFIAICWLNLPTLPCYAGETPGSLNPPQQAGYFMAPDGEVGYSGLGTDLEEGYSEMPLVDPTAGFELSRSLETEEVELDSDDWAEAIEEEELIPDPLEPMNRVFFQFNDKLYFWILKPVSTVYEKVFPELARVCIRNFFSNLYMPIRAVNCLLQGKFEGFGKELVRFMVNSTAGFMGFQDVAKHALHWDKQEEDFGQTLAFYGIGPGFYINLPVLGPSTLRDTVGWVGDQFVNPLDILGESWPVNLSIRASDLVNNTSLRLGEYESFKKAALDPYVALREAFWQYRKNQIEK